MMLQTNRDRFIFGVIFLAFLALLFGAWRVMIVQSDFLQQEGDKRQIRNLTLPAARGAILDRRGNVLAMSTPMISVAIDPKVLTEKPDYQISLASALRMPLEVIQEKVRANADKRFVYLKRGLAPQEAQLIEKLPLDGVHLLPEFKRFYPSGEVTSHVIGFTNIDDQGIEGIELGYNDWLKGTPGVRKVIRDNLGRVIETVDDIRPAHEGNVLRLSLDRDLQFFAYRALKKAMIEHQAKAAELVLLDVHTGEVLAMVSQPGFNPNDRALVTANQTRNRVVTDVFEPGSTIKPIIIAGALELGKVQPDTVIDTGKGKYLSNDKVVRDHHGYGQLDLAGILRKSSNIGMVKIVETMTKEEVWRFLHFAGLGQETGIVFPGEQTGRLRDPFEWYPVTKTTAAYGYGYNVTLLQLAHAYSILANDGISVPVSLIALDKAPTGKRVYQSQHARLVLRLMEEVVSASGTGRKAAIAGYHVAGKTGTTRKANRGYDSDKYRALFVGVAPASAPRFVLAVTVEEPTRGQYYGGDVAAPIFHDVMEETLRLMAVPPDDVTP
ncbi:MAG: penicillin-binding protein 2 [Thiotrichales bacterium]|nr:penicillin-binding protein 2 [Thiotrichales bacterium]